MDRFDAMATLVAAVDGGSLSAASRALGMPLATVSRKVSELEGHLRKQLVIRQRAYFCCWHRLRGNGHHLRGRRRFLSQRQHGDNRQQHQHRPALPHCAPLPSMSQNARAREQRGIATRIFIEQIPD